MYKRQIEDDEGKKKAVLNKKETAIAQSKQEMIKQEFQDWIWSDPERRERFCKSYNEKFNSCLLYTSLFYSSPFSHSNPLVILLPTENDIYYLT